MKRRAEKQITQLDDEDEESNDDQLGDGAFRRATDTELAVRPIKGLPKRQRQPPVAPSDRAPDIVVGARYPGGSFGDTTPSLTGSIEDKATEVKQPRASFTGFGFSAPSSGQASVFSSVTEAPLWTPPSLQTETEAAKPFASSETGQLSRRPGSPVWESPTAGQEFYKRPLEVQHRAAMEGLNTSFVKAVQAVLDLHPAIDIKRAMDPLLDVYERHKQAIDLKHKPLDNMSVTSAVPPPGGKVDEPAGASSSVPVQGGFTLPTPPAPGPFIFGGKTASFGNTGPSPSSASSEAKSSLPGAPTVPVGGFTFAGKVIGPASAVSIDAQTSASQDVMTEAPSVAAFGDVPMDGAQPMIGVSSSSDRQSDTVLQEATSFTAPAASSSFSTKLSPFSAFATSTKPKNSSPLASQPPISGSAVVKSSGAAETTPSFGKLASKFSPTSPAGDGMSPATQIAMSAKTPFSSPAPFNFTPASSKPSGTSLFGFGAAASGPSPFGFGASKLPVSTGFSFGTAPLSSSSPADKDKTTGMAPLEIVRSTSQPSSSHPGTISDVSSLGPSQAATPEPEEGEENEITVQETKCKLYKAVPDPDSDSTGWQDMGVGWLRLKKDKVTGKRRVLFRQDGTGRVEMNFYVYPSLTATITQDKVVGFTGLEGTVPMSVRLRCKSVEHAQELKAALLAEVEAVIVGAPGVDPKADGPVIEDPGSTTSRQTPVLAKAGIEVSAEEPTRDRVEHDGGLEENTMDGNARDGYGDDDGDDEIEELDPEEDDGYDDDGQGEEDELEADEEEDGQPEVVELLDDDDE